MGRNKFMKPSERQMKIFRLLSEGFSNKEVADKLKIHVMSVSNDILHVKKILKAKTTVHAAVLLNGSINKDLLGIVKQCEVMLKKDPNAFFYKQVVLTLKQLNK